MAYVVAAEYEQPFLRHVLPVIVIQLAPLTLLRASATSAALAARMLLAPARFRCRLP